MSQDVDPSGAGSLVETPAQILRLKAVMARTGMGRSFLYREMAAKPEPRFPKPIKIGRASGWNAAEVDAWVRARLFGDHSVES